MRVLAGVTFYPYDTTTSRVKSWVAISGDTYLGIVEAAGCGWYVWMTPDGLGHNCKSLADVASSISSLDELVNSEEDSRGTQD